MFGKEVNNWSGEEAKQFAVALQTVYVEIQEIREAACNDEELPEWLAGYEFDETLVDIFGMLGLAPSETFTKKVNALLRQGRFEEARLLIMDTLVEETLHY